MKLRIAKADLVNGLTIVSKAVPSKSTADILQCVLISATDAQIRLLGNDTEMGIQSVVQGEILERGMAAIDAQIFSSIVRKLPDAPVLIETEGEQVHIRAEKAKFDLMCQDGLDFPRLPEVERSHEVRLTQYTLRELITRTLFSAALSGSNTMMTGELLEVRDGKLRVVALDGHRIAIRSTELAESTEDVKVIIPGKAMSEVSKILPGDTKKMVSIFITDRHAMFTFDDTLVVTRLIDGKYFNVDSMFSVRFNTTVKVQRRELLDCIDRATLLVRDEGKKPVIMMIRDGSMELRITTAMGRMDETMEVEKSGEDLNIGFNPRLLIDALRAIDEETITLQLVSQKAPCFIGDQSMDYCYIVLPVNFISID